MLSEEQLAIRKTGVSGSEVAAVAGLSPWKSPQDVWADKLGLSEPLEQNEAMERGNYLESALLRWMADREGVIIDTDQQTIRSPDHDLVIATPDGLCYLPTDDTGPVAVAEVKSPGWRTARDWADPQAVPDGIPTYYLPQVTWEMAAANLDQAIVGALLGGKLQTYRVDFNPDLYQALLGKVEPFWEYVLRREPPPVAPGTADPGRWLRQFYSQQTSDEVLEPEGEQLERIQRYVSDYDDARELEKRAKEKKNLAAARLQEIIGERQGIAGGKFKVTWKQSKDREVVDWKAVAADADVAETLIEQHTERKPGSRRLTVTLRKD
jgi:putative phage-type endonuclease